MALLVLMYHRAQRGPFGNAPEMLDAHFATIAQTCHVVLPGEPCRADRLNACLTFDDAYYDFAVEVLPRLEKHRLRAVLAVPTGCVAEATAHAASDRLVVAADDAFRPGNAHAFCTWTELEAIARTGLVAFAAHGHAHVALDQPGADLAREIEASGNQLEQRLACPVSTFVFPYGRYSRAALRRATRRYRTVFRIGGASNRDWRHQPVYRVNADNLRAADEPFRRGRLLAYRTRSIWNRLRGR